jgi:hypothetical protein
MEGVIVKTKKVVKQLTKIETLISKVTDRCSKREVQLREALQDAKFAFTRAKKAVNSQVSSEKAKSAGTKRKKVAVKKAVANPPTAKAAKKSTAIKKAVQRAAAKRMAPARVAVTLETPVAHVA